MSISSLLSSEINCVLMILKFFDVAHYTRVYKRHGKSSCGHCSVLWNGMLVVFLYMFASA